MAGINIKLEFKETEVSFQKKINAAINKKIQKFLDIFVRKLDLISAQLGEAIDLSPVASFLKSDRGRGDLGIIDPDGLLNNMKTTLIQSSNFSRTKKEINFNLGSKESLRGATSFEWANTRGDNQGVNIFSLIENEIIADWTGTGLSTKFNVNRNLTNEQAGFSRTGLALMLPSNTPYTLPEKFVNGFTRFWKKKNNKFGLQQTILKAFRDSLREAGFTVRGR